MTACARPDAAVASRTAIAHSGKAFTAALMENLVTMTAMRMMRQSNVRIAVAALGLALAGVGCSGDSRQAAGERPLPESGDWLLVEPERTQAIIRGAREYCREMAGPIAGMCRSSAVPIGQLMLVEERLREPARYSGREPLCIFGITGTAGNGDEYLAVTAFNQSREIVQVDILARASDVETVVLSISVPGECKSSEAIWTQYFVVRREPWRDFRKRVGAESSSRIKIDWEEGTVVPVPSDANIELCVRVVDRMAGSSTWVPVCAFDYPK